MKQNSVWGCVLIGGKSRRMGQAKHLIRKNGITWLEQAVFRLRQHVDRVVISGEGVIPATLYEYEQIPDVINLQGPMAGILAVMRKWPEVSWLIVACDQPEVRSEAFEWLLSMRSAETNAVLPDLAGNGRIEPLLAYYDQRCRMDLEAIVADGSMQVNRLKKYSNICTPQPPEHLRRCWCNVNRPEDLLS